MSKPCVLCGNLGMVASPGDWKENGGWENCPMCHPPEPPKPGPFRRIWRWIQARYRLDLQVVCEMSAGRGPHEDFHDYTDDEHGSFLCHMVALKCVRCGKEFFA